MSDSSSPYSLDLTNSIYQSQYSFQINSYIFWPAMASSNFSIFAVTSLTASFTFERIHLSSSFRVPSLDMGRKLPSSSRRFIITNREAFQSLLAKFRHDSSRSILKRRSFPGLIPVDSINLSASAPYCSITSRGSTPFPNDLLIFLPSASLTSP